MALGFEEPGGVVRGALGAGERLDHEAYSHPVMRRIGRHGRHGRHGIRAAGEPRRGRGWERGDGGSQTSRLRRDGDKGRASRRRPGTTPRPLSEPRLLQGVSSSQLKSGSSEGLKVADFFEGFTEQAEP